jgi:hypothetical protein
MLLTFKINAVLFCGNMNFARLTKSILRFAEMHFIYTSLINSKKLRKFTHYQTLLCDCFQAT